MTRKLARAGLDRPPGPVRCPHFQAGSVGGQQGEVEAVLVRVGQQVAALPAGLVAVELQVRGAVAGEGQLRRPGPRVVAGQRLGHGREQPLELGAGGQGGAVQAARLRVRETGRGALVDQARPEGLGEVGPVRPGRNSRPLAW